MKSHDTITCRWRDKKTGPELVVHGKTIGEAVAQAEYFGYVSPKWWEFWKEGLHLTTLSGLNIYVR